MRLVNTSCCAMEEISDLRDNAGRPHKTVKQLCEEFWGPPTKSIWGCRQEIRPESVPAFIIFSGVEHCDKDGDDDIVDTGYAQELADYINENNLGIVTRSVKRKNRVNHPDHTVRIYIWAPSPKGLIEWYKKNK